MMITEPVPWSAFILVLGMQSNTEDGVGVRAMAHPMLDHGVGVASPHPAKFTTEFLYSLC